MSAFSVTAFAYTGSSTYYTSNQTHESSYSSGEEYLRNRYDYGSGWPGDECVVQGWSENYNGKYAYVYVYLRDDDYAQYGKVQCKLYSGSTSSTTLTDHMYMYVYDTNN